MTSKKPLLRNDRERGSILISAVLFMAIAALLLTGIASLVKMQVKQLSQVQNSYEVRSMINLAEKVLTYSETEREAAQNGNITFNKGSVEWSRVNEQVYRLKARLDNGHELVKEISVQQKTIKEPDIADSDEMAEIP
ncbi:competence type IV pilus minor pilin ComGG [Marinilactibacillus sp. Marseille-P9653]|uniref:competence type IV pilus minor pilin ComGG n=1 Tax=Marinilactibacillus sp. Marseille-P9653 TaxID=2866583 RepID=UPI001CE3E917|nr:competence type IV pilus minor pilin ComGG [Marinilactibacillus sp. Marseille-P9653]